MVTATNCSGSVTSSGTPPIEKATQPAPAAPTMLSRTSTSITLTTVTGCQYSRDGGVSWHSSPEFTGLTPNTSYTFTQRKAETATHKVSPASSSASFTTLTISVINITGVPTTAVVGTPLTLTGTVVPADATFQTIIWSVHDARTTGATITGGNILNKTAAGTVTVRTTIVDGTAVGVPYTKDFDITVSAATSVPELTPANPLKAWTNGQTLYISGIAEGKLWRVFGVSGQLIHQGIATSDLVTVPLNVQGVYIVQSEDWSVKVLLSN